MVTCQGFILLCPNDYTWNKSNFGVVVPHHRPHLDGNLLGIFSLNYKLSFSFPSQGM